MSDLVTGNEHYYNGYKDGRAEVIEEILSMRKTIIDEYGIIHSVVKSEDLEKMRNRNK